MKKLYEVEWNHIVYLYTVRRLEISFLRSFACVEADLPEEYHKYMIDEDHLNEVIETYMRKGRECELPQELIKILKQRLEKKEDKMIPCRIKDQS